MNSYWLKNVTIIAFYGWGEASYTTLLYRLETETRKIKYLKISILSNYLFRSKRFYHFRLVGLAISRVKYLTPLQLLSLIMWRFRAAEINVVKKMFINLVSTCCNCVTNRHEAAPTELQLATNEDSSFFEYFLWQLCIESIFNQGPVIHFTTLGLDQVSRGPP